MDISVSGTLFKGLRVDNREWIQSMSVLAFIQNNHVLYYMPKQGEESEAELKADNDRIITSMKGNFYQVFAESIEPILDRRGFI